MAGLVTAVSVAVLLTGPVVMPVALTPEVRFANDPALPTVTSTVTVQVAPAASTPARSEKPASPAESALPAASRAFPPHPLEVVSGEAMVIPNGKVSVKTTLVRLVVLLVKTKVKVVVSPTPMEVGANDLVMPMRPTVKVAVLEAGP